MDEDGRTVERRDKGAASKGREKQRETEEDNVDSLGIMIQPRLVAGYTHAHSNCLVILTLIAYLSFSDIKLNYALYYIAGFAGERKRFTLNGIILPMKQSALTAGTVAALVFTIMRLPRQFEASSAISYYSKGNFGQKEDAI